jgi:hypothetical protein
MKEVLQRIWGKLGYQLMRVSHAPKDGLTCFFEAIQRAGFAPRHIVDVGANHGDWTRSAIRFFPDAQYTLVEPQDELKAHIQDLLGRGHKVRWVNVAFGDNPGTLPLTIASHDHSSTLALSESEARASGARQVPRAGHHPQ